MRTNELLVALQIGVWTFVDSVHVGRESVQDAMCVLMAELYISRPPTSTTQSSVWLFRSDGCLCSIVDGGTYVRDDTTGLLPLTWPAAVQTSSFFTYLTGFVRSRDVTSLLDSLP